MTVSLLLVQLIVVLVCAHVCGWLLRYIGQPSVVGEMAAGIALGPLGLGLLFPELHRSIFPADSLAGLSALATIGLVFFMFVIGLELRAPHGARAQAKAAGCVGLLSVAVPMALGVAVAPVLHPLLAPPGVNFWPFALFMAVALSVTAFPVLARILKDKELMQTRFGQLSLGSAAVVDVFAWIFLAFVVALAASEQIGGFVRTTLGALLVIAFVYLVLKPLCARLLRTHAPAGEPSTAAVTALVIGLLVCALMTEWIHLHAVFGAFLFGTCLPRDDRLLASLSKRIEPVSVAVLIPLFFALAGLGLSPNAFVRGGMWAMVLILLVAVIGKLAGSVAGARLMGYSWQDSLATGALMNARGLMELVVMKVGLDAGLIGVEVFTMLFLMATATTAMAGPLIALFTGRLTRPHPAEAA